MATLVLPTADRRLESYTTGEPIVFPSKATTKDFNRIAFAAAHVVADPLADTDPWLDTAIDWEKTVHFRHYLWDLGLGVAEAMDTAQRGGGLDWPGARELIRHTLEAAKGRPGVKVCCGVGTDHLEPAAGVRVDRGEGTAAHLRRAVHWRRYSRGPVGALHRSCGADIARGSLRLLGRVR